MPPATIAPASHGTSFATQAPPRAHRGCDITDRPSRRRMATPQPGSAVEQTGENGRIDRTKERLGRWRRDTEQSGRDQREDDGMTVHGKTLTRAGETRASKDAANARLADRLSGLAPGRRHARPCSGTARRRRRHRRSRVHARRSACPDAWTRQGGTRGLLPRQRSARSAKGSASRSWRRSCTCYPALPYSWFFAS